MKLRLRSVESRAVLRIETPNPCTIPQLKSIICETLPGVPSPSSIRLSLNRKDELESNEDDDNTLQSLGVTNGDLIYFSLVGDTPDDPVVNAGNHRNALPQTVDASDSGDSSLAPMDVEKSGDTVSEAMDSSVDEKSVFSVPGFLRKVFGESIRGEIEGNDELLVVVAVHAVMLESGLRLCGEDGRSFVDGYHEFNVCSRYSGPRKSLSYRIPESVGGTAAVLKFQRLGKFMFCYGTLKSGVKSRKICSYRVELDVERLFPALKHVKEDSCGESGELPGKQVENEVFALWRSLKDNLALPLLIDLCEEAGFELPPCFMRLPVDLKSKILELLPGVDLAKVCCVSSELNYLGSREDLWLSRFEKEFGFEELVHGKHSWKAAFADIWDKRKRQKHSSTLLLGPRRHPFILPPIRIIGGEHDMAPQPLVWHSGGRGRRSSFRRLFSPRCDLGSHDGGDLI